MGSNVIARRVDALIATGISTGEAIARAVSETSGPEPRWYTTTNGSIARREAA